MLLVYYTDILIFELFESCFPKPEVKFMVMVGRSWTLLINSWAWHKWMLVDGIKRNILVKAWKDKVGPQFSLFTSNLGNETF